MKKQELLQKIDNELIEKLYGFCYARTNDSYEAQDLCSDILYALIKTAAGEGEIRDLYGFIWRVARNVYADFSEKRRRETDALYGDDPEEILSLIAALLDMRMKYSLPAIFAGVCLAGVIMCCASYGVVSFLSFLL